MIVVNVNELEEILFLSGKGRYSFTSVVSFDNKLYCFKSFKRAYRDANVINRICDMTDMKFSDEFIVPLYMVTSKNNERIIGYLSLYYENLFNMDDSLTFDEQITLIKSARDNIELLHHDYNRIHGDLHFENILFNKENLKTFLLDFDLSMKIGQIPETFDDYTLAVQKYLKYYPFDINVDKFHFNLCTVQYLAKFYPQFKVLIESLNKKVIDIPGINNDVKRLSKELLLKDTRKPYSGEYIIDYIN